MSNVTNIGDWVINRKTKSYFTPKGECGHKHLQMEDDGAVVKCTDCGVQVSAYWALENIVRAYNEWTVKFNRERETFRQSKEKEIHLLAAKKVESAWRSRSMVPTCPHCRSGILPSDGFGGGMINKEIEMRRRAIALEQSGVDTLGAMP